MCFDACSSGSLQRVNQPVAFSCDYGGQLLSERCFTCPAGMQLDSCGNTGVRCYQGGSCNSMTFCSCFNLGTGSGSNCIDTKTCVVCGTGDTDSECVHCTDRISDQCNSKDCKLEDGACVAGNGLMTATVDKDSKYFLTLTVTLPYTKDQFDQTKRDKYKAAVANAAGTVAANVEIVKITEARRRAGKVDVETKVRRTNQRARRRAAVECRAYHGASCLL